METLFNFEIVDVAMEGYAFGSQMANMLGELGGMVKLTLLDFGIYPLIVPPTNLKKYVTGKGNGISKSQMLLYVYKKWGVDFTDDNAADSYALARLVAGMHETAYEKEVYDKLQDPKFREK
jgi:Holliday junction resolvasome RuvABC endonuclease subunit